MKIQPLLLSIAGFGLFGTMTLLATSEGTTCNHVTVYPGQAGSNGCTWYNEPGCFDASDPLDECVTEGCGMVTVSWNCPPGANSGGNPPTGSESVQDCCDEDE